MTARAAFVRESLTKVMSTTYDTLSPKKYMSLLPVDNTTTPGTREIKGSRIHRFGKPKIIAPEALDIPLYEDELEEYSIPVRKIALHYKYSDSEIDEAINSRTPLQQRKATGTKDRIHTLEDEIAWIGDPAWGLEGFLAHSSLTEITSRTAKSWLADDITPQQMLQDFIDIAWAPEILSGGRLSADTVVMPTAFRTEFVTKSIKEDSDKSLLDIALARCPHIKTVEGLSYCDSAGSSGKPVIQAYKNSKECLHYEAVMPFTQKNPQERAFTYFVYCHSEVGGVMIHDLDSAAYMEF